MNLKGAIQRLDSTDRAVSPVIGVILMVAITVILAAVIGTFVLDLGQSAGQSAPSASLGVSADSGSDEITISHNGGDRLDLADTQIVITDEASGDVMTINQNVSSYSWTVGNQLVVNVTGDANDGDGPGDDNDDATVMRNDDIAYQDSDPSVFGPGAANISAGVQPNTDYTVRVIDTNSDRQIAQSTVSG